MYKKTHNYFQALYEQRKAEKNETILVTILLLGLFINIIR